MSKLYPKLSEVQLSAYVRAAWVRGLLSVALADNDYSPKEQSLIQEFLPFKQFPDYYPRTDRPSEIATVFKDDPHLAQNFLRTAVMVALVDGNYSDTEHKLIQEFCTALNQELKELSIMSNFQIEHNPSSDLLQPVRAWLDGLDIRDSKIARFLCKIIPAQCPFERDVLLFGRKVAHIPAMCQINPLYDQLVGLRFRSLTFLADECGEDISEFC